MKPFNLVFLMVFIALAVMAVFIFATFTGRGSNAIGTVEIWGSLPKSIVASQVERLRLSRKDFEHVRYTEVAPDAFIPNLVEAIAANRGPDLVIFPAGYLIKHGDKLYDIPYSTMSRRTFQDTFIEAGEIFLGASSFRGFPYVVDPLVMYWNRTLFADAGIAAPPRYWDEVMELAPRLTEKDQGSTLIQSAVALGSWDNVLYAKRILLSLLRQLGNPVVSVGSEGITAVLENVVVGNVLSAESAFRFYTEFANPTKPAYSWNRAQSSSRDAFLAGRLAMYVGTASELFSIRAANPNLNFDVALLPSARGAGRGSAADLYALSVPRGAKNPQGAVLAALVMTGTDGQRILAEYMRTPPVRRELLTVSAENPYSEIFRAAALSAFSFLDPDPAGSDAVFRRAVENVLSGKRSISDAIGDADNELRALLK